MEHPDLGLSSTRIAPSRKTKYIVAAILVIATIVLVGVLVGLYGGRCVVQNFHGSSAELKEESSEERPWLNVRLPDSVVPVHYDLYLFPDIYNDHLRFSGNVRITVEVKNITSFLLVHVKLMNITSTKLYHAYTEVDVGIKRAFEYAPNQFWVVELFQPIAIARTVILEMNFTGTLRGIEGFYRGEYINSVTGKKKVFAANKFEPVDARRAFPCFDEPNLKATFTIRLRHRSNDTALSNMPMQFYETSDDGMTITTFQKSVPMSTYLVCLVIGDFDYKELATRSGKPIRVYAVPEKVDQVDYALAVGKGVFDGFEEYFDMEYPLPKIDLIGLPDYSSGAMEHWGAITFRENNLLYIQQEVSTRNKQRIAEVVAHELAHQWFGNIVTMDWWDDLWLNEGFASFMEYKGVDFVEPNWNMQEQFVINDVQRVFVDDSRVNSNPIVSEATDPEEIQATFGPISYLKGSSVIRMLEGFLGKENFRNGIRKYLKMHKYKNAKTADLWKEITVYNALSEIPPVPEVMNTWTRQMGLPVIDISYEGRTIKARQSRFLADNKGGVKTDDAPFGYKWFVPLHYVTSHDKTQVTKWMEMGDITFVSPMNVSTNSGWIKFNVNVTGYYRVNYPTSEWMKFADILNRDIDSLWPSDRAGLLNDAFALARSGRLDYYATLSLASYLRKEYHYLPWESATMGITQIREMLRGRPLVDKWNTFIVGLCGPVLRNLTWNNEHGDNLEKFLRTLLIHTACSHGDLGCLQMAGDKLREWMNGSTVHPDMRLMTYQYGMQYLGSEDEFQFMYRRYRNESVIQEKMKLLYGLANVNDRRLLMRLLSWTMDNTKIYRQDFLYAISFVSENPIGREVLWTWLKDNYQAIEAIIGSHYRYLGRVLSYILRLFNTDTQLQEVLEFFARHPVSGPAQRLRAQALELIRGNISWMNKHESTVWRWLDDNIRLGK